MDAQDHYEWDHRPSQQQKYPPPPFSDIPRQQAFQQNFSPIRSNSEPGPQYSEHARGTTMNNSANAPIQNFSHIYNNDWQYPVSPPPRANSDNNVRPGAGNQSMHDTTRSRLDDDRAGRQPGRNDGLREWERRRVTKYRRNSSSSDSYPSDRTVHPRDRMHQQPDDRQRLQHYDRQRSRGRVAPRERERERERAKSEKGQQQQQQQIQKKPGFDLEQVITPLRLGVLLGCFDLIGGSLSIWMTNKRFGKAAQAEQAKQQQQQGSGGAGRSKAGSRRSKKSDYSSDWTDSEEDERRRRTEDYAREQGRLDYGRRKGGRR